MSALPVLPKAAVAAIVCASLWRAFFGAPAPATHRRLARLFLALTGTCYALSVGLIVGEGPELLAGVLVILGIESSCVTAWLVRATRDDDGGDDGGGGGGGGGGRGPRLPPPIDWDAFDRARRSWDRTPAPR